MGSTRAGAGGEPTGRGADLLSSAAALRWARPDLTGAIADHVLETAGIAGDQECWLAAAAWAVHARSATGDGRETASDVMGRLSRFDRPLDHRSARRLRIELAQVAATAGEVETARGLLGPVLVDETEPELRADLLSAVARCAVEDAPERVAAALRAASEAWAAVPGSDGEVGAASVALISAVVDRRNRRPDAAVDHAAEGLTRLERGRGAGPAGTPSGHLAAALAAEWISALLDAGRADEARDGCVPLMPRLAEPARASRQLALLRLTVARAVATGGGAGSSVGLLEQAAEDAAASDAPDLESVCRTALGALQEKTGPLETALETLRLGVAAERRDRARIARFRSALAELPPSALRTGTDSGAVGRTRAEAGSGREAASRRAPEPSEAPSTPSSDEAGSAYDWDAFLRAAETGRPADGAAGAGRRRRDKGGTEQQREAAREQSNDTSRRHDPERRRGDDQPARRGGEPERREPSRQSADRDDVREPRPQSGDSGVLWENAGDSPIGDLLFRSLRPSGDDRRNEPDVTPDTPRNGTNGHRPRGAAAQHGSESEPSRNGHGRSQRDETAGGSHRRPTRDDATSERERDGSSWAAAANSWLADAGRYLSDRAADDESSSGRSTERSRGEDAWPLADPGGRGEEPGSWRSRAESGGANRDADQGTSGGGRRHRAESPWSTGRWPGARRDADDAHERDRADRADRSGEPTELLPPARTDRASQDPERWLRDAIADLDRVWGPAGPGATGEPAGSTEGSSHRQRPDAADEQCTVVIDVARDGRRFAGRRAGVVVRAVADRLTDRLPRGARLRLGESDALSISMPGWDRGAATEWLHRTLPGLLAGFDAGEDLPSAQLRAAVHDADGPVGAQILQSLEQPSGRRHDSGVDREPERPALFGGWGRQDDVPSETRAGRRRAEDREPRDWERASDRDRERREATDDRWHGTGNGSADGSDAGGRRHRRDSDANARGVEAAGRPLDRPAGEHDRGTARNTERRDEAGSGGTTAAKEPTAAKDTTAAEPTPQPASESTEGLGIADLLAGALDAYRAI